MFEKKRKKDESMKETVDRLNKSVGDGFKVVGGDDIPLVLHMLLSAYYSAPLEARQHFDREIMQLLVSGVPRAALLAETGEYLPMEFLNSLSEDFLDSMRYAEEAGLDDIDFPNNATMQSAVEIAEAVDKAVRVQGVLSDQSVAFNHRAHLDIIAGHAYIVRGLKDLMNVPAAVAAEIGDVVESGTDS